MASSDWIVLGRTAVRETGGRVVFLTVHGRFRTIGEVIEAWEAREAARLRRSVDELGATVDAAFERMPVRPAASETRFESGDLP
jgi:hypothetical protein